MNRSVFEWWFQNQTIWKPNFKTFSFQMDSVFKRSVFEPPLYIVDSWFSSKKHLSTKSEKVIKIKTFQSNLNIEHKCSDQADRDVEVSFHSKFSNKNIDIAKKWWCYDNQSSFNWNSSRSKNHYKEWENFPKWCHTYLEFGSPLNQKLYYNLQC